MPTKIVATLLCSNNESIVQAAVESVLPWIDALCFIDTGSTDRSLEIARSIAGDQLIYERIQWCNDFSGARNAALQFASRAGAKWSLTIDTDERMDFSAFGSRAQLVEALDCNPNIGMWLVASVDGSYFKERFIRVPTTLQWQGRTHESIVGSSELVRGVLPACSFSELSKTAEQYQRKLERDLPILLEETAAKPDRSRWWYYLGQTYEGLKEYRAAVAAYDRCLRLDASPDEASWAGYAAARCLVELKEFRRAEEYCALGLTRKPSVAELPWLAGWCCYQRGAWRDAITWSKMAIHLGSNCTPLAYASFRHVPAWHEAPHEVMHFAYQKLGEHELARESLIAAAKAKCQRT